MSEAKRLAIIGGYPPPFGGVTTHIMRLCSLLDEHGIDYVVYNAVSATNVTGRVVSIHRLRKLWILWYALCGKEKGVYLASQRIVVWLAGAFMAKWRKKAVAVRLQNAKVIECVARGGLNKAIVRFALRRLTAVVCVNRELAATLVSLGIAPERVHVFPGFLPPSAGDRDPGRVDGGAWQFAESHSPLIAANGKVALWKGEDLYGLDMLVDLAERLKAEYPNVGILVCFWNHCPEDQARLNELIALVKSKGVAENLYFNTKRGLFVPVLEKADLFVRPTATDGDANSIREALYVGTPAIASDVVKRPEGTTLFATRNVNDLTERVFDALRSEPGKSKATASEGREIIERRIRSYLDLLEGLICSSRTTSTQKACEESS